MASKKDPPGRRRGRPPAPEGERRGENLTLRIRAETKDALERAAAKSGRSLSAEAEAWLGQATSSEGLLDQAIDLAFGRQTGGLAIMLAEIARTISVFSGQTSIVDEGRRGDWLNSAPYFDQAVRGITEALEFLRPDGDPEPVKTGLAQIDRGNRRFGKVVARMYLQAIVGDGRTTDIAAIGEKISQRLGSDVVKRIKDRLARAGDGVSNDE